MAGRRTQQLPGAGAVLALWGLGGPQADGLPGGVHLPTEQLSLEMKTVSTNER